MTASRTLDWASALRSVLRTGAGALSLASALSPPSAANAQAPSSAQTTNAWDAAHATSTVTICLRSLGAPTAVTREALHRIEAELSASGFLVDQADAPGGRACAASDPSIKLRSSSTVIDIAASAGPGDDPVLQTVNVKDSATTAELIAIRAVEGLRAAMIQALRRSADGRDSTHEAVRRFTRQADEGPAVGTLPLLPEESAKTATEAPAPRAEAKARPGSPARPPAPDLLLTLGGALAWDGANPGMNGTLSLAWLLEPVVIGIGIDAGILAGSWEAPAGSVELRPFGFTGNVALRLPCSRKWECHLGAAAGLRQFSIAATSAPSGGMSSTAQENHSSAVLMLDGLVGYFPAPRWGFFTRAQGGLLLDAPALEVGDQALSWGRPSLAFTLGLATRF